MMNVRYAGLTLVACCSVFASAFSPQQREIEDKLAYRLPDGQSMEVVGVGDISLQKTTFWDVTGKLDPTLSKKVLDYLVAVGYDDFYFRFGWKNRYIVVKVSHPSARVIYSNGICIGKMNLFESQNHNEPYYDIVQITTSLDNPTFTLDAQIALKDQPAIDLLCKAGTKGSLESSDYEVGKSITEYNRSLYALNDLSNFGGGAQSPGPTRMPYEYGPKWLIPDRQNYQRWNLLIARQTKLDVTSSIQDLDRDEPLGVVVEPLTDRKVPIEWVNSDGVSTEHPKDILASIKQAYSGKKKSKEELQTISLIAMTTLTTPQPGVIQVSGNIDFSKVAYLRIKHIKNLKIRLAQIPLEPKSQG